MTYIIQKSDGECKASPIICLQRKRRPVQGDAFVTQSRLGGAQERKSRNLRLRLGCRSRPKA